MMMTAAGACCCELGCSGDCRRRTPASAAAMPSIPWSLHSSRSRHNDRRHSILDLVFTQVVRPGATVVAVAQPEPAFVLPSLRREHDTNTPAAAGPPARDVSSISLCHADRHDFFIYLRNKIKKKDLTGFLSLPGVGLGPVGTKCIYYCMKTAQGGCFLQFRRIPWCVLAL